MKAKIQALKDMHSLGIMTSFVLQEKEILEFISEGFSLRVDFRKFNGGHYDKHNILDYTNDNDTQLII